jgi:4-hydroxybutyrate dehydrogenase/sulfolactaldehyde 3-reductase
MQNLSNQTNASPVADRAVLFVGLGTMGLPMATNLVRAGYSVQGSDASESARAAFVQAGGRAVADAGEAAAQTDVVVTMLPDDRIVLDVLAGAGGLLGRTRKGALVVEMSTTGPSTKLRLAAEAKARGLDFIECPVGKTMEHAIAGTLTLMAAGDGGAIERARPLLAALGNELHVCGDVGAGSAMKLINNALVACINAASIEALVAGRKAGLSLDLMMSVFRSTMAWNNALANGLPRKALRRDFKPGFMTRLAHKDVGLALAMGREIDVRMTQVEAAHAVLAQAIAQGFGADDTPGSVLRVYEDRGGVEVSLP